MGQSPVDSARDASGPQRRRRCDAAVSYRWGPVAAQVNLKNLGNVKYFTRNNSFVLPSEPFTVLGQLTWRFP
jgi:hypothetical protein